MNTDSSLSPTNIDSTLMNTSSNLNMMQTATSDHEQYQSTNSKSVTNAMLDYEYPRIRLGIHKLTENT